MCSYFGYCDVLAYTYSLLIIASRWVPSKSSALRTHINLCNELRGCLTWPVAKRRMGLLPPLKHFIWTAWANGAFSFVQLDLMPHSAYFLTSYALCNPWKPKCLDGGSRTANAVNGRGGSALPAYPGCTLLMWGYRVALKKQTYSMYVYCIYDGGFFPEPKRN